ncbi:hypothetical protein [Escherichia coli]
MLSIYIIYKPIVLNNT